MLEDILKQYGGVEVEPSAVYKDIYSLGEGLIQERDEPPGDFKANPIGYYRNGTGKGHFRIFFDDTFEETLHELQEADFAIMNGITYFGRKNVQEHASKMYAMIFDLDGVTDVSVDNFLHGAFTTDYDIYPVPNYIALSGHGLHLYYVFDNPIPLYPNIKIQLKAFKYALTEKIWNEYTSTDKKKQFQGINQGFRPIGGKTKIPGVRVRAFEMYSHPYTLKELGKYIPEEHRVDETKLFKESKLSLVEAKKKYPQWYQDRIMNKQSQQYWTVKRDLYDWWIRQIKESATYHHRYFNVMCLAIYAAKCGIDYEELKKDALDLVPFLNDIKPNDPFTVEDAMSALECYDKRYCTFPIDDIEKISGIHIERNKRNGRKQEVHLAGARAVQKVNDEFNGTNWRDGNGRKSKKDIVIVWRRNYPDGSKKQCKDDTGLTYPTIRKWWNVSEEVVEVKSKSTENYKKFHETKERLEEKNSKTVTLTGEDGKKYEIPIEVLKKIAKDD